MTKRLEWRTGNGIHRAQEELWEEFTRGSKPPGWDKLKRERSATLLSLHSYGFTLRYLYSLEYEREPDYVKETVERCAYLLSERNGEWVPVKETGEWHANEVKVPDDDTTSAAAWLTQEDTDDD